MPERLDAFMARANAAYYASHDPFADFTTAPEILQVFGELLGAWAAITWDQLGRPAPLILAEAGPGRGTLMADALRLTSRVAPDFHAAAQLHLIETSPRLRQIQARAVPGATWHDRLEDLPGGKLILLANEFLDALPVRQFVRLETGWAERHVQAGAFVTIACAGAAGMARNAATDPPDEPGSFVPPPIPSGTARRIPGGPPAFLSGGTTAFLSGGAPVSFSGGAPGDLPASLPADAPPGAIFEIQPAARGFTASLAARIAQHGGAALILDYGRAETAFGDSLQAVRHGQPADPLAAPGETDLTVHVDFQAMAEAARDAGVRAWGPLPQGTLLTRLGLVQRVEKLAAANPGRATALLDAARRLAAPARMGHLFKALAITQAGAPPPPGFEP